MRKKERDIKRVNEEIKKNERELEVDSFSKMFQLLFLTGQFLFSLSFFYTGSGWITRVKPPGVCPHLHTPHMHSVTISVIGCSPVIRLFLFLSFFSYLPFCVIVLHIPHLRMEGRREREGLG